MGCLTGYLCEVRNFQQYAGDSPDQLKAITEELDQLDCVAYVRAVHVGNTDLVTLQVACYNGELESLMRVLNCEYVDLKVTVTLWH